MTAPAVTAAPPPGWARADGVARPPLGQAAEATFTAWDAWRAPSGEAALVAGCVAAPIPGWVEEMRPAVEARAAALVGAAAERITTIPTESRPGDGALALRGAGTPEGSPALGAARWALGFSDDARVVTCFVLCGSTSPDAPAPPACAEAVRAARFAEGAPPPAPGVALGAVRWGVHHPGPAAAVAGALVACAAVLAVAWRRKPRARIHGKS